MRGATSSKHRSRRRLHKLLAALCWAGLVALTATPSALAAPSYGRGLWGVMHDSVVTVFGFILIVGFPLVISLFSLIQWRLDKRKEARKAAEKSRLGDVYWNGGW